ncbi:MAG: hypothetical protein ACOC85_03800 [Thermoplasmatota archaeon]
MVDMNDLNIFDKLSTGSLALISGMAIIGTATFILSVIFPLFRTDPSVFYFSMISLCLCGAAPLFLHLDDLFDFPDVIAKFMAGALLAGFAALLFHVNQSRELGSWLYPIPEVFLTGLFSFITIYLLIKGVVIPIMQSKNERRTRGWEMESEEEEKSTTDEENLFEEEEIW